MKEIHFYLDNFSHLDHIFYTYDSTEEAIKQGRDRINTTSLANITFDLLDMDYRIFVHRNGRVLECKLGSMDGTEKEIRKAHNLLKLIMGHVFDEYFEKGK
jgi:hypothetical protein